jgi:hypothetical protein
MEERLLARMEALMKLLVADGHATPQAQRMVIQALKEELAK